MITRSAGRITGAGYTAGSGYSGKTEELDNIVQKEAELLQKMFERDVVIRFNSDRESGTAFIKDGEWDDKVGLGAQIYNKKLFEMLQADHTAYFELPKEERYIYENTFDSIRYSVIIDANAVKGNVTNRYKNFDILDDAVNYLRSTVQELNF